MVVGELLAELCPSNVIVMGHDWGGPIGLSAACTEPQRVSGLVLGNTWFWPADWRGALLFSRVMASRPLQRAIVKRNLFVERILPAGFSRGLSPEEMEHYRAVQATEEDRIGVAELPKQIVRSTPWLAELEQEGSAPARRKAGPDHLSDERHGVPRPLRSATNEGRFFRWPSGPATGREAFLRRGRAA